MQDYSYESASRWTEKRRGLVECDQTTAPLEFSAPTEFQGDAGYWTPEHLMLAAVSSCFITTFRAIAELSKFDMVALEVSAGGTLTKTKDGYEFSEIIIRPMLTVAQEAQRERGLRLLEKAEHLCLISRSLKPAVKLRPLVEVEKSMAGAKPSGS
mgnify:CR=1 FL=1